MNDYILIGLAAMGVAVLSFVLYKTLIVKGWLKSEEVHDYIVKLILKAEEKIVREKAGQERLAWVLSYVYGAMPDYLTSFITLDDIIETINYIFSTLAVKMEDGTTKAVRKE